MAICKYCGEEIEFRRIDGLVTPIHLSGGWCSGAPSSPTSSGRAGSFQSTQSYTNPNALCPVCGDLVFFYRSPFGGRVFFDDLGWPWPKHPCTDNPDAQTGGVRSVAPKRNALFANKYGEPLIIYMLAALEESVDEVSLKLQKGNNHLLVIRGHVSLAHLKESDITVKDIKCAPSFVVRSRTDYRIVEFISGKKSAIVFFKMSKPGSL